MQFPAFDPAPVVKIFNPTGSQTWLLAWIEPENPDIAFGLCDLGFGTPEMGSVSITELQTARGQFNLPMERDQYWRADKKLSQYAEIASAKGRIVS